jgi:hypothetical protein
MCEECSPLFKVNHWGDGAEVRLGLVGEDMSAEEWDMILVYNSLEEYLGNRFKIKGRPWIGVLSFHFEDTHDFYTSTIPIQDMGIDAVFTNCRPFVDRGAPFMPVKFVWPPMGHTTRPEIREDGAASATIGAYISSIDDRDFSLLDKCHDILVKAGYEDRLEVFTHPSVKFEDIPVRADFTGRWQCDLPSLAHTDLKAYIPTPRVSDILMGVVDDEMVTALALGYWPVWVRHRKFEALQSQVTPIIDSLNYLGQMLRHVCDETSPWESRLPQFSLGGTDLALIDSVKMAYRRKRGAAAGGN